MDGKIVIIGGGHAAAQLCVSLQEKGLSDRIHLICGEAELPYQRPPLSKIFLKNVDEPTQAIRGAEWFDAAGVRLHRSRQATNIDRIRQTVALDDGQQLDYSALVLATGTKARRFPLLDRGASNALSLRTASDAMALRQQLASAESVVVLGGGFIGLEVAATALTLGKRVTVIEMAPRLMGRSVSAALAEHVRSVHASQGIDIRLGAVVQSVQCDGGRVVAVHLADEVVPCDLLLVAIGAEPDVQLAQEAGLACDNGILVDAGMSTSDPAIFAIGDCTSFPIGAGRRLRLESIQNANDQARVLAARMAGQEAVYAPIPWFWSEQGGLRLQMVGLLSPQVTAYRRDGSNPGSFSLFHFEGGRLSCVESVNAPMDHMVARKWIEAGRSPSPEQVINSDLPLKTLLS